MTLIQLGQRIRICLTDKLGKSGIIQVGPAGT